MYKSWWWLPPTRELSCFHWLWLVHLVSMLFQFCPDKQRKQKIQFLLKRSFLVSNNLAKFEMVISPSLGTSKDLEERAVTYRIVRMYNLKIQPNKNTCWGFNVKLSQGDKIGGKTFFWLSLRLNTIIQLKCNWVYYTLSNNVQLFHSTSGLQPRALPFIQIFPTLVAGHQIFCYCKIFTSGC